MKVENLIRHWWLLGSNLKHPCDCDPLQIKLVFSTILHRWKYFFWPFEPSVQIIRWKKSIFDWFTNKLAVILAIVSTKKSGFNLIVLFKILAEWTQRCWDIKKYIFIDLLWPWHYTLLAFHPPLLPNCCRRPQCRCRRPTIKFTIKFTIKITIKFSFFYCTHTHPLLSQSYSLTG